MGDLPLSAENFLGGYRLVRKLGEGGMGTVYLAFDEQLARHVAVKVLRVNGEEAGDGRGAGGTMAKRFLREAQSAARINHAHAVTIHHVGTQGGRPFLVMEYLANGSLADELRKSGRLGWRAATMAVRDALLGLGAAHRAGVIHRDIKPANLMRGEGGVKVVDFGLARVVYGPTESEITYPGAFVGSPSYASPEQAGGGGVGGVRIDGRSDLYSLAATWYALLTGQPPFVDDDPGEVMRLHMTAAFPELRGMGAQVPRELEAVMRKASAKDPGGRYVGAAEMGAAVEGLLALPEEGLRLEGVRLEVMGERAPAERSIAELEGKLAAARRASDSTTQLWALRGLYSLYQQMNRREEAARAFREGMVVHVKLSEPRGG